MHGLGRGTTGEYPAQADQHVMTLVNILRAVGPDCPVGTAGRIRHGTHKRIRLAIVAHRAAVRGPFAGVSVLRRNIEELRGLCIGHPPGNGSGRVAGKKVVNVDHMALGEACAAAVAPGSITVDLTLGIQKAIHQHDDRRTAMFGRPLGIDVRAGSSRGVQTAHHNCRALALRGTWVLPGAGRGIATLNIFWLIGGTRTECRRTHQQEQD